MVLDPDPVRENSWRRYSSTYAWALIVTLAVGIVGIGYAFPASQTMVDTFTIRDLPWPILVLGFVLGLAGSVRFTLLDTTIFSLDRAELLGLAHSRPRSAKRLADQREDILRTWFTLLSGSLLFNLIFALSVYGLVTKTMPLQTFGTSIIGWAMAVLAVFVLGELLPGLIASRWMKRLAPFSSRRFYFWTVVFLPMTIVPMLAWKGLLRMTSTPGFEPLKWLEIEKRLLAMIGVGAVEVDLKEEQRELIDAAIDFGERTAGDVMLPRGKMVGVEISSEQHDVLTLLKEIRHSRIPVYEKSFDEIVGVLRTREVLLQEHMDYHQLMHSPIFVDEDMELIELMVIMRRNPIQLVIVLDVHGSTTGMVSMNDVLEALVGELPEEETAS